MRHQDYRGREAKGACGQMKLRKEKEHRKGLRLPVPFLFLSFASLLSPQGPLKITSVRQRQRHYAGRREAKASGAGEGKRS